MSMLVGKRTSMRLPTYRGYLLPGLVILLVSVVGGLLWNFYYSFTRWPGVGPIEYVGLKNYSIIFTHDDVRTAMLHAAWFVVPMSIIPTLLGIFVAAVISDYLVPRFGQGLGVYLRGVLFLTTIIPMSITGQLWRWILDTHHGVLNDVLSHFGCENCAVPWLDNARLTQVSLSVIMVWLQLGFAVIIFMAGMARLDESVYEAAELDGAGWFSKFWHITIPLLLPEFAVVGVVTLISGLKVFAPVYWITDGGPFGATTVPSLYSFNSFFGGGTIGYGSAVSTLLTAVMISVALYAMRIYRKSGRGA